MRKYGSLLLIAIALLVTGAAASFGEYPLAFYPNYSIAGTVNDAPDGKSANGYKAYFYQTIPEYSAGFYAYDTVGTDGLAGIANRFLANAFSIGISNLILGGTYYVGIPNDNPSDPAMGYGADPVGVVISGSGLDTVTAALSLTKGGGAMLPPPPEPGVPHEPAPAFKIWFGKRLYQPGIYGRKEDDKKSFVISEKGTIKIEVDIPNPFLLNESASYTMSIQSPLGVTTSFDLSALSGVKASATGLKPLVIETNYPEDLRAVEDESVYMFTFNAASRGTFGTATSVTTACAVTVMGGPTKILDIPIAFPSPLHLKTDRDGYIQYTLSKNANVDIYVYDISARMVKKFICNSGAEGGNAGVNKVKWDLITDQGTLLASGIYVMTFVERDSGKLLSKGKFTALP